MTKQDEVFDVKFKFLYETSVNFAECYFDAIMEAYNRVYRSDGYVRDRDYKLRRIEDKVDTDRYLLSPAEVLDDLACVMYEYENKLNYDMMMGVSDEDVDS